MLFNLNRKKSAGVLVTGQVHRLIQRGNAARDRQDWATAAAFYGSAVAADPKLRHIWIQLAHMQKEADCIQEALESYEHAYALSKNDAEPLLQIAHMLNARRNLRAAAEYFIKAIRTDHGSTEALTELVRITQHVATVDAASLYRAVLDSEHAETDMGRINPRIVASAIERVLTAGGELEPEQAAILRTAGSLLGQIDSMPKPRAHGDQAGVVFDVTDLIAHFRHHRLPTGIQRVQIEVVSRALNDPTLNARVCCFVDGKEQLLDIPSALFMELAIMSTAGKDDAEREWNVLKARLFLHLLLAEKFGFKPGDCLVNLGTSWWVYNYFLLVRNAKREFSITYVPFVHDLIPIMATEHCVTGVTEDYVNWLIGAFHHADHFLVNSSSTGRDLIRAAERIGHTVDPKLIEIVPLNADFRQPLDRDIPPTELKRWRLSEREFCLFVSTIESRKNHILALDAWARLIEVHGDDAVPMLVCVGRMGWLNESFAEKLNRNPRLRAHVLVIERASDAELTLLYRSCRFTVYPSHYEGWGLPITESLCYGRVPVAADNSSLREAGGDYAVFFESNSVNDMVAALERVLFEPGFREVLEQQIAATFKPRSWGAIASQVTRAVAEAGRKRHAAHTPVAIPGRYYPVSQHKGTRIWHGIGSGEIFRGGEGWHWPEPKGSRTTAAGGELLIKIHGDQQPLRLYVRLRGLATAETAFCVAANGNVVASGNLHIAEERWVLGNVDTISSDGVLSISVLGAETEMIQMEHGGTRKDVLASISVVGFALHARANEAGRIEFLEKAALAELREVDAYSEPDYYRQHFITG